jgi:DNA-binding CsgD family transcriptional regulator
MFSAAYALETFETPIRCEQFFDDGNLNAAGACDDEELTSAIRQFATSNGFQRFNLAWIDVSQHGSSKRKSLDNIPPEFLGASNDPAQGRKDPVLRAARRLSLPFVYGPETYTEAGVAELWDQQAEYGYCHGLVSPFHLSKNLRVILGVDRFDPLPSDPSELARLVSSFHLFATFAQCAAREMVIERSIEPYASIDYPLTPRELECLKWAAAGKTAWETGMILSIAEGSVAKLLGAATRKLDCTSKAQAMVKALKLGLIH